MAIQLGRIGISAELFERGHFRMEEPCGEGLMPAGVAALERLGLNGEKGAAYGDDAQSATNYPLVRVTNLGTGHVFYSRTHDHSSMAVAFGGLTSTHFDVPVDQETGPSILVVVANGIPSAPVPINVQ